MDKSLDENASENNHQAYKDGCKYYNEGNFKKAKNAFLEAIEYWPKDPQAWFALGNCFDELNKPARAEDSFRKSLSLTPKEKQSDVLYNLGNSLLDQAKFPQAIECYSQVSNQSAAYRQAQMNMKRAIDKNAVKNS